MEAQIAPSLTCDGELNMDRMKLLVTTAPTLKWCIITLVLVCLLPTSVSIALSHSARAEQITERIEDLEARARAIQCGELAAHVIALPHSTLTVSPAIPLTVLAIGSSSTSGVGAGSDALSYPKGVERTLRHIYPDWQINVHAYGVGGETAEGALSRLPQLITQIKPSIVIWQVGTNDALRKSISFDQFRLDLQMGERIVSSIDAQLIFVDPQFFPKIKENSRYRQFVDEVRDFALQRGHSVVRRYTRMRAAEERIDELLAADRFHMSALGHVCLALDIAAVMTATSLP